MRIFIAGATGVLGKAVLQELEPLGHEIVALARTPESAAWLREHGTGPVSGDITERGSWTDALKGCDAVMHLATAIPKKDYPKLSDFRENDRVRVAGTRILVEAAERARVGLYLQQSVALVHGNNGKEWIDEDSPVKPNGVTRSAWEMEKIVDREVLDHGFQGAILRLGSLYGPGSWHTDRAVEKLRQGSLRLPGGGDYYWSLLHVEDAARAFVTMLDEEPIGDTVLFTDDEPVMARAFASYLAEKLGTHPPKSAPTWLARLMVGKEIVETFTASLRVSNKRAKQQHGWKPAFPTYREGVETLVKAAG